MGYGHWHTAQGHGGGIFYYYQGPETAVFFGDLRLASDPRFAAFSGLENSF
jgi:hypothetical protein